MVRNIVQLNNRYIQDENQHRRNEKESQKAFANKLKNEEYAAKYARAKYYYSKKGEYIYTIPGLLPQ